MVAVDQQGFTIQFAENGVFLNLDFMVYAFGVFSAKLSRNILDQSTAKVCIHHLNTAADTEDRFLCRNKRIKKFPFLNVTCFVNKNIVKLLLLTVKVCCNIFTAAKKQTIRELYILCDHIIIDRKDRNTACFCDHLRIVSIDRPLRSSICSCRGAACD